MAVDFPTEVLERIIYYYFQRDELLPLQETNFTRLTPIRGSTPLLVVSKNFRLLVLPSLFYSISITEPRHWELLLRTGSGLLNGEGEEAWKRRSWVRELRIDMDGKLPIALEPDGVSLSPDPTGGRNVSRGVVELEGLNPGLIPLAHIDYLHPKPTPFPNLDRLVLLLSSPTAVPHPWPPRLLRRLEDRHLEAWREASNLPLARYYSESTEEASRRKLAEQVWMKLVDEGTRKKELFYRFLSPKNIWIPLEIEELNVMVYDVGNQPFWSDASATKHLVFSSNSSLPSSSFLPPSSTPKPSTLTLHQLKQLEVASCLLRFESTRNIRLVAFPPSPRSRRRFWDRIQADKAFEAALGSEEGSQASEDDGEGETALESVKRRDWACVEEDGTTVDFEEALGPVEEATGIDDVSDWL